ncbi:PspC family transcriptional regulator (plasmid) [Clostridium botulinum A2B3 87]|uniref:PspC domain-containing protein n=1 Tax=Clostridium botulinum TaxID=1491 RepID=UPI0004A56CEB|nr:PspC domain-containing protein [Clostridium botulinum]KEI94931.1 PspC family transcriptional regulator [Clostridium botulinum A2B3 87]
MKKKFMKSNNKKIYGVCGGIAEYLGIDATTLRLIWCAAILLRGIGGILYLLCAILMPQYDPEYNTELNFK